MAGRHPIPLGQRVIPATWRSRVREAMRPWFHKLVGSAPAISAKHRPIRPFERVYTLPRQDANPVLAEDGLPAPPQRLWQGYAGPVERFLKTGRRNVKRMRKILAAAGRDLEQGQKILDFGCAAAPMTRCLVDFAEQGEVWGVDISAEHMWWCRNHLGPRLKFTTVSTQPQLPFEDRKFDLVYCGSVFSHIPELADSWLCELGRVIRPGGTLYLTFVPIEAMHRYLKEWPQIGFSTSLRDDFPPEVLEAADFDLLLCGRAPWSHIVYRKEVFLRMCEQVFDVVSVTPNVYTYQWALVLSRR